MRCLLPAAILLSVCLNAQSPVAKQHVGPPPIGYLTDGMRSDNWMISADDVSKAEQQIQSHPEDSDAQAKLLKFYWYRGLREPRLQLIYRLIENQPGSDLHSLQTAGVFPPLSKSAQAVWYPNAIPLNDPGDYAHVVELWNKQIAQHPNDAKVLFNAARALGFAVHRQSDVLLIERAQELEPQCFTEPLAQLYSQFLLEQRPGTDVRADIATRLASSEDANLIAATAAAMLKGSNRATLAGSNPANAVQEIAALLSRGQQLEPGNPRWSEMMRGASQPGALSAPGPAKQPRPVRAEIGQGVAASSLLYAPPLVYPVQAKNGGTSGNRQADGSHRHRWPCQRRQGRERPIIARGFSKIRRIAVCV